MMKSLSPCVVFILLVACRMDTVTWSKVVGVSVMTIGMMIACYSEPKFTPFGLLLMFLGESSEALRMVFFQHLLGRQKFSLVEGLFYTCPANFFFLTLGIALFEERALMETGDWKKPWRDPTPYIAVSALGFFVLLTTLGVIQTCGRCVYQRFTFFSASCFACLRVCATPIHTFFVLRALSSV